MMAAWYVAGALALAWAMLIPAHMRAVDSRVLEKAGKGTRGLMVDAEHYGVLEKGGVSWTMYRAGQLLGVPPRAGLAEDIASVEISHPGLALWGNRDSVLPALTAEIPSFQRWDGANILSPLSSRAARERIVAELKTSPHPATRELLRNREWREVSRFSPVGSAAGAPLETAICLAGLLAERRHLAGGFEQKLGEWAALANQGKPVPALEDFYQELLVVGGRCGWGILAEVSSLMSSPSEMISLGKVLRSEEMAALLRKDLAALPAGEPERAARGPADPAAAVALASLVFVENPGRVLKYLERHSPAGLSDLALSLRHGAGATRELLARGAPVSRSPWRDWVAGTRMGGGICASMLQFTSTAPTLALLLKYELILMGAFFVARGASRMWFQAPAMAQALPFGAKPPKNILGLVRQAIFACLALIAFIYFAEPHLAQGPRAPEPPSPPIGNFSVARAVVSSIVSQEKKAMFDQYTLITLVLFFVIQASVYAVCLVKLAEIHKQAVSSRVKLRLLENEENLFDAGLYVGLGGTAATLVFVSLGIIKPSLIAAYSSTLFGIIFVAVLKIIHLRPIKRRLILDTEEKPTL